MSANLHSNTVCTENMIGEIGYLCYLCAAGLDCLWKVRRESGRGLFVHAVCECYRSSRKPKSRLVAVPETVLYK